MSRNAAVTGLLAEKPRTTRDLADALGIKVSTATVYVTLAREQGLIRKRGKAMSGRRSVTVWEAVQRP